MRIRPLLAAGCIAAVSCGSVAVAAPKPAPKPACDVLVDPAGDELPPSDPSLDIVSADLANNATTLTAVIRVAKLSAADQMSPTGRYYNVTYDYRSTGLGSGPISALLTPTGDLWVNGDGTGVVDVAKSEIRISVPISRLGGHPLFKPGDALEHINAQSDLAVPATPSPTDQVPHYSFGASFNLFPVDRGVTEKTYPVGAPSCVKVGA
ncbi:MAG: hypothetical protein JWP11_3108 [Frankiales bacterium]|nr:hypothetical protein [Frankiales bacterium]